MNHLVAEIDLAAIKILAVFFCLSKTGDVETKEILGTFQFGIGMFASLRPKTPTLASRRSKQGESVDRLGCMIARAEGPRNARHMISLRVTISSEYDQELAGASELGVSAERSLEVRA